MFDTDTKFRKMTRNVKPKYRQMKLYKTVMTKKKKSELKIVIRFEGKIITNSENHDDGLLIRMKFFDLYKRKAKQEWAWHGAMSKDDGRSLWNLVDHGRDFWYSDTIGRIDDYSCIVNINEIDTYMNVLKNKMVRYFSHLHIELLDSDIKQVNEFIIKSIEKMYPDVSIMR